MRSTWDTSWRRWSIPPRAPRSGPCCCRRSRQSCAAARSHGCWPRFYSADRTTLVARTGLGEGAEALMARFAFPASMRGGAMVALTQQRQPVFLPADCGFSMAEHRWAQEYGLPQFGVFPLIVLGKVVGCLYCDRAPGAEIPDRATVRYVKSVADCVVDAIGRRRQL